MASIDSMILHFFRDEIGGIRITDAAGAALYEDPKSAFVSTERTNWAAACPPPREGQSGEMWDLLRQDGGKTYMVTTSTVMDGGTPLQIHQLVDTSVYTGLYQDITDYSRILQEEKEHDGLTRLYNKGKFMSLKQSLFRNQDAIAVFNMDVNNLKAMNDNFGHEAGDRLILKAAESLRRIEARNVLPFRVGGDEFVVVALHVSPEEAKALRDRWARGLEELNRAPDDIHCAIACGMAYGEKGYSLEDVLAEADRRMYEDKKAQKAGR